MEQLSQLGMPRHLLWQPAISIKSLFEDPFMWTFAPACPGSVQLGVAMSHAMGTSRTLQYMECLCMDLNPSSTSKTRSQFAPGHQAPLCPENIPDFAAIAKDGPD